MRIALVGMKTLSEPDPDAAPLLRALREAGHVAQVIAWDDDRPRDAPESFDVCLLRATWNYYLLPETFIRWVERTSRGSTLVNGPEVVRWNMHKRYLIELGAAGIPTIPTVCIDRGGEADLEQFGWSNVVIKPAISAASWQTRRFDAGDTGARSFLDALVQDRDVLVQPFIREVAAGGELAMVWIDGQLTHAVVKAPRFHGGDERVMPRPDLDDRHRDFAREVMAAARQDVLYARIDVIELKDGSLMLSELEMIEPSLYFEYCDGAIPRFVAAVERLAP